jgi:fructoselysine-6-P-deglycase FrlB-like protein
MPKGATVSHAATEISSQPSCWADATQLAGQVHALLPSPGERVAVVGCGTSFNMALAYARLREDAGRGLTDAMAASEALRTRQYDRYLLISRSGTTSEVLDVAASLPPGARATALTVGPGTPLAEMVPSVMLPFAGEESVVQTRFATSVLVLLRRHLGEDTSGLPEQAGLALAEPLPEAASRATRFSFVGSGWTVGLAHEAALKLREAAQMWTESYAAKELRHGPISVLDAESVVWCFGPVPDGLERDVRATGATFVPSGLDPLAELVRAQRVAVELAGAKGLDVDHPRNLSFSVVLGSA